MGCAALGRGAEPPPILGVVNMAGSRIFTCGLWTHLPLTFPLHRGQQGPHAIQEGQRCRGTAVAKCYGSERAGLCKAHKDGLCVPCQ